VRQLEALQSRMAQLLLPLPIRDASELLSSVVLIRVLLREGEGQS
jgi:hypothetical protein